MTNCKLQLRAIDWKEEKKGTRKGGEEKEDEKIVERRGGKKRTDEKSQQAVKGGRGAREGRGRSTGRIASSRLQMLRKEVRGTKIRHRQRGRQGLRRGGRRKRAR